MKNKMEQGIRDMQGAEDELDPAFAERDRRRKAGIPVEIAVTERLLIRESILEDVPMLYEIQRQPGMGQYLDPMQPSLEEETEFMAAYIRHAYAFYDFGLWTVLERESGRIVGRAGLFLSRLLEEGVELGYMIAPDRQRRGYAAECGRAILAYASEVLDIREVHVLAEERNLASVRTARRLSMEEQGRIPADGRTFLHFIWKE